MIDWEIFSGYTLSIFPVQRVGWIGKEANVAAYDVTYSVAHKHYYRTPHGGRSRYPSHVSRGTYSIRIYTETEIIGRDDLFPLVRHAIGACRDNELQILGWVRARS